MMNRKILCVFIYLALVESLCVLAGPVKSLVTNNVELDLKTATGYILQEDGNSTIIIATQVIANGSIINTDRYGNITILPLPEHLANRTTDLTKRQCCGQVGANMKINYYSSVVCYTQYYMFSWNIQNWVGCADYYVSNARSWLMANCYGGNSAYSGQCQAQFFEFQSCGGGAWPTLYAANGNGNGNCQSTTYFSGYSPYSAYVAYNPDI